MNTTEVREWLIRAMGVLEDSFTELTELDSVAGDGDLGVTVRSGAREVGKALAILSADASPADLWRTAGASFARGNPSSFAALMGAGLLAASRAAAESSSFTRDGVISGMQAASEMIALRGRSVVGQRTVLDALVPSIAALADPGAGTLESARGAAQAGVDATRAMEAKKGRAMWVGTRSMGHPDAGATAYLRFIEALAATAPERSPSTGDDHVGVRH